MGTKRVTHVAMHPKARTTDNLDRSAVMALLAALTGVGGSPGSPPGPTAMEIPDDGNPDPGDNWDGIGSPFDMDVAQPDGAPSGPSSAPASRKSKIHIKGQRKGGRVVITHAAHRDDPTHDAIMASPLG